MDKTVIYISIPITGRNIDHVIERCKQLKDRFKTRYNIIVNPFDLATDEDGVYNKSYGIYMGADIKFIIDEADIVIFDKGYQDSRGCLLEYRCAELYNKTIMVINDEDETLSLVEE